MYKMAIWYVYGKQLNYNGIINQQIAIEERLTFQHETIDKTLSFIFLL